MVYDAIIVGARCAGASTGLLLARKGHQVLLVDRSAVPSEIPHGHFIHRGGPQRLHFWGVLAEIEASGCPLVTDVLMSMGGSPLVGKGLHLDGVPFGCGPRRGVLDKILVDTAVAAGAELRDQFVVEEFLSEDGRITGIKGRDLRTGHRFTEYGRIVIGADGRNSRLAQTVQAPVYEEQPVETFYYFSYWSGVPINRLEVHVGPQQIIFAFPTSDGLFGVFVSRPVAEFHRFRGDIEANFMQALAQAPALAAQVRAGHREERFYGTADLPNFFRKPYGPGWALVGDAGHHKDPYMALGIADALRDAELVVEAVHDGLAGVRPMPEALAGYEQQRNEQSRPLYYENLARARFTPPPPEFAQIRAALLKNRDQEDINCFMMVNLGLLPREAFFHPENVGRIMQRANVGMATAVQV
ncbi:MAG: NAD(P)/FAD-dependent oxidoreductase [Anaerolineae bacterium]|nr:NAD(P)/FAD-dependent oxidoreductase [Anaerolineae bacterium]